MTATERPSIRWREITIGLILPDSAFGAAVDVDDLLDDPELHFAATASSSRLMLMPQAGAFSRLLLEWETLPEIGVFTSSALTLAPVMPDQLARLETWMRDVAVVCHGLRDRIREAAERAVRDAALGHDTSLPANVAPRSHLVSAQVGTSVAGPGEASPFGVVDVEAVPGSIDEMRFVRRETGETLGRRITRRDGDEIVDVALLPVADGVDVAELVTWYDQHIAREVLFDDVWQVYVHLIAGLDAPASIRYFA